MGCTCLWRLPEISPLSYFNFAGCMGFLQEENYKAGVVCKAQYITNLWHPGQEAGPLPPLCSAGLLPNLPAVTGMFVVTFPLSSSLCCTVWSERHRQDCLYVPLISPAGKRRWSQRHTNSARLRLIIL